MLYLKKITKYDIPLSHMAVDNGTSLTPPPSNVYISQRETLEAIAGAYTLDILNSGDIAAVLVDCPKAIQDTPRVRHILRHEEAYIVNESGETITTINGKKNVSVSGHSLTINPKFGEVFLSSTMGEAITLACGEIKLNTPQHVNIHQGVVK